MDGGEKARRQRRAVKGPFEGYKRPRDLKPDETLTRVGRGTPGGEYLRRFWHPVCLSAHLTDVPRRLRILGEDLVAFRDKRGKVGVLELHCPHRGTSLEFGKVEECGIRCCYHGWHFDVDGRILDTPGEPDDAIKRRLYHGAYPAREWMGLVFAYMGPPEKVPAFPVYDAFERPDAEYVHRYRVSPCNWIQVRENEMDPIHLAFLHTRLFGVQFQPVYGEIPTMEWVETPIGMAYLTVRRWKDWLYLRVNDMILPNVVRVAGIEDAEGETVFDRRGAALNWVVPIDDTNTINIGFGDIDKNLVLEGRDSYTDRMKRQGAYTVGAGDVGQTGEPSYEDRQKAPGDWDAWTSQGAIAIHARENLGTTDRGVTMYRKLLRQGMATVKAGKTPKNLHMKDPGTLLTYCHNTVKRVRPANSTEAEEALSLAFGREIFKRIREGALKKSNVGAEYPRDFEFSGKAR